MLGLRVVHVFEHGVKKELIFLLLIVKDLKRPRASVHSEIYSMYCMFCNILANPGCKKGARPIRPIFDISCHLSKMLNDIQ